MITQKAIDNIYRKYNHLPDSPDDLDIMLLFEHLLDSHNIEIDDNGNLIINSLPSDSPFHSIRLDKVHAIIEFEDEIAVVMHSSIIFLNKSNSKSYVHIKAPKLSLIDRLKGRISNACL